MRKSFQFLALILLVMPVVWTARRPLHPFYSTPLEPSPLRDAPGPVRIDIPEDSFEPGAMNQLNAAAQAAGGSAIIPLNVQPALAEPPAGATQKAGTSMAEETARANGSLPSRWFPDYSNNSQPLCLNDWPIEAMAPVPELPSVFGRFGGQYYPQVPTSKLGEVAGILRQMKSARSYEEALILLRQYLRATGAIQHFRILSLVHSSNVAPNVIAQSGIWSSAEAQAHGISTSNGWTVGSDGVYFYDERGLQLADKEYYGEYHYKVKIQDVDLIIKSFPMEIFYYMDDILHSMWSRDVDWNSRTATYFPLADYSYSDLGIDGIVLLSGCGANHLGRKFPSEIFIHRMKIDPGQITMMP